MPRIPGPRATIPAIVVAVVIGVVIFLVPAFPWSPFYRCDDGLRTEGAACIGVSDRSDFGDPLLATVMSRIAAENDSVTGPYYTVGYLLPLEAGGERTAESTEMRRELEGVHVAQLRANRTEEIEGGGPKIKLVVGNAGNRNTYWPEVVDRFHEMAAGPERLRAVAGMGNSFDATRQAIAALTRPGNGAEPLPVIGSRLTADSLSIDPSSRRIDGFFRAAPTNTDEARAAAAHIRERGYTKPVLLRDTNKDDTYAATLGQAFRTAYGPTPEETFDSGKDGLPGALTGIVRNLCLQRPDVVYFAGRGEPLAQFVDVLANRQCLDLSVDVVTGDDISGIQEQARAGDVGVRTALSRNLSLTYTGLADPAMWDAEPTRGRYSAGALAHFRPGCDACFPELFPGEPIDGAAIMGHDAMLLAVTAIRLAGQSTDAEAQNASPSAVIQMLSQIRGVNSVAGASGNLSMSPCGDPEQKLFPILTLAVDGTSQLIAGRAAGPPLSC